VEEREEVRTFDIWWAYLPSEKVAPSEILALSQLAQPLGQILTNHTQKQDFGMQSSLLTVLFCDWTGSSQ